MFELTMAATRSNENPAIVLHQSQKITNFHRAILPYGMLGHTRLTAIGSLAKVQSRRAKFRVGLQLVRNVRRRRIRDVVPMQLDRTRAIRAAKLSVIVAALKAVNPQVTNIDDIAVGDVLQVPGKA